MNTHTMFPTIAPSLAIGLCVWLLVLTPVLIACLPGYYLQRAWERWSR